MWPQLKGKVFFKNILGIRKPPGPKSAHCYMQIVNSNVRKAEIFNRYFYSLFVMKEDHVPILCTAEDGVESL